MLDRRMTNRRVVLIVLTLLAFFVSILEPVPRTSGSEKVYKSLKSAFEGIPDAPLDLGPDQNFCSAFYDDYIRIDIDFSVTIAKIEKRFTNIFQTDDLNAGLRVEISPDGKVTAFAASPDGGGPERVLSVLADGVLKAKVLTKISMSVYSNVLTLQIDEGLIASQEGDFRPTCNHVLIGGGYDNTRTTIGDVRATVRLQDSKLVTTFGLPMGARDIARILFTLFMICLIWEYRKKIFILNDKGIE
jgi:hypothetical protein